MIDFDQVTRLTYIIGFDAVCGETEDGDYDDRTLPAFFSELEPLLKAAFPNATFDVWADNMEYVSAHPIFFELADGRTSGWSADDEVQDLESAIEEEMQGRLIPAALTGTE